MNHNPTSNLTDRRRFVTAGGVALAGLALAPSILRAQTPAAADPDWNTLYGCAQNPDGTYALPPLPYAYEALEPAIDAQTMHLHHDIHFLGYANGLNATLKQLAAFRDKSDFPQIQYWENQLAFHGSGYFLHTVFFQNMAVAGSTTASAGTQKTLADAFGSFDAFKAQFSAAAAAVEGAGWAILGWQSFGKKLVILQAEKHQNLAQWGITPLLVLDVWEHAYYLKYQNRRADYIKAWWSVVNWDNLALRLAAIQPDHLMVM
jgi:superoxide dismutase, Fe-Mn family